MAVLSRHRMQGQIVPENYRLSNCEVGPSTPLLFIFIYLFLLLYVFCLFNSHSVGKWECWWDELMITERAQTLRSPCVGFDEGCSSVRKDPCCFNEHLPLQEWMCMATSWHEKGGWRMWRTLAAAFLIFLTNMQNPGWSLGMFIHCLFSPILVDCLGNCGFT